MIQEKHEMQKKFKQYKAQSSAYKAKHYNAVQSFTEQSTTKSSAKKSIRNQCKKSQSSAKQNKEWLKARHSNLVQCITNPCKAL